jgi:outer membrane protein OmpA-like peptidoglycan-associated protein
MFFGLKNLFHLSLFFVMVSAQAQSIYFELDQAKLDGVAKKALQEIIRDQPAIYLQIECHCDSLGTSPYNLALSQRRAEVTKKFLIDNGFKATHIRVAWFGKERPLYSNQSADRYKNRRCDITGQRPNSNMEDFQGQQGEEFIVPNLVFVGNQAIPMQHAIYMLDSLYELVRRTPARMLIKGHVCCSDEMELSEKRALQVKNYLVARGIDAARLEHKGFSNHRPLVKEVDAATREMNRRVEIEVLETLPESRLKKELPQTQELYFQVLYLNQAAGKGNLDIQSKYNMKLVAQVLAETPGFFFQFEIFGPRTDRRMQEQLHSEIDMAMRKEGIPKSRYQINILGEIKQPGFSVNQRHLFLRYKSIK